MEVMTTKNWLLKLASNGYSRFFLRSKMKVDTDAIFVVKRINLYAYDLNGTQLNLISVYIYTLNGVWLKVWVRDRYYVSLFTRLC